MKLSKLAVLSLFLGHCSAEEIQTQIERGSKCCGDTCKWSSECQSGAYCLSKQCKAYVNGGFKTSGGKCEKMSGCSSGGGGSGWGDDSSSESESGGGGGGTKPNKPSGGRVVGNFDTDGGSGECQDTSKGYGAWGFRARLNGKPYNFTCKTFKDYGLCGSYGNKAFSSGKANTHCCTCGGGKTSGGGGQPHIEPVTPEPVSPPEKPKPVGNNGNQSPDNKPSPPSSNPGSPGSFLRKYPTFTQRKVTCSAFVERQKSTLNRDAYNAFKNTGKVFQDPEFPAAQVSLWTSEQRNSDMGNDYRSQPPQWKRLGEIDGSAKMWGSSGPLPNGVTQGLLGDCWFLSAAAAIAEHGERIKDMFVTQRINQEGVYQVKLFPKGVPTYIAVDDRLAWHSYYKRPYHSSKGQYGAWWLPILEKAYAKMTGSFAGIDGGSPVQALRELSGMPSFRIQTGRVSQSDLFNQVLAADQANYPMAAACNQNWNGLYGGHAYTLLGAVQLRGGPKLYKMRNPHGAKGEKYRGPWSDSSSKWTSSYASQVGLRKANDGVFYLAADTFSQLYTNVYILHYKNWKIRRASVKKTGKDFFFTVKSPVSQKLVITLDYTPTRQVPEGSCARKQKSDYNYNMWVGSGSKRTQLAVAPGAGSVSKEYTARAGEKIAIKVRNWNNSGAVSDFHITSYSESSASSVSRTS